MNSFVSPSSHLSNKKQRRLFLHSCLKSGTECSFHPFLFQVVLSAILGATMAAPAAQLVAGHGLVGAGYAGLGLAGHGLAYAAAPAVAAAPVAAVAAAPVAAVHAVPAVNVHAVHTTVH